MNKTLTIFILSVLKDGAEVGVPLGGPTGAGEGLYVLVEGVELRVLGKHLPPAPGGGGEHLPILEDCGDDGGAAGVAEAGPEAQGAARLHAHQVQVVPVFCLLKTSKSIGDHDRI